MSRWNYIFLIRAWNICTNLRKSTLLLICYFFCPFHCQSHSFPPKEARFSVFADEKNFLKPPIGTYFLPLCGIWAAPQVEPGQRIPRMFPCVQLVGDDLPIQQTSQPVVVVVLATGTSWLSSTAQTRELQLNLSKQKQLQLWGNQGKGGRQVPSTGNHWTDGWWERYWSLV